jgi:hypothetical protein
VPCGCGKRLRRQQPSVIGQGKATTGNNEKRRAISKQLTASRKPQAASRGKRIATPHDALQIRAATPHDALPIPIASGALST